MPARESIQYEEVYQKNGKEKFAQKTSTSKGLNKSRISSTEGNEQVLKRKISQLEENKKLKSCTHSYYCKWHLVEHEFFNTFLYV